MNTIFSRGYDAANDSAAVRSVAVTATPSSPTTADEAIYHWHIFLRMDDKTAVLLDILPGADGRKGVLLMSSKGVSGPTEADAATFEALPAAANFAVKECLDFVSAHRLDKYIYDETGSGCRWWCTTVLQRMEEASMIKAGSTNAFLEWVQQLAEARPANVPMPVRKGAFY